MSMRDELERVVLVDEADREVGEAPKLEVHRTGALHRAFSVFIVDSRGDMLLQRRARGKYHTPGLWTNACCGHPRPGEAVEAAAGRRLEEEMGFVCSLERRYAFVYQADLGADLSEHEYDHVFLGRFDGEPDPDPNEVWEWRWLQRHDLVNTLAERPEWFTPWFRIALPELLASGALDAPPAE